MNLQEQTANMCPKCKTIHSNEDSRKQCTQDCWNKHYEQQQKQLDLADRKEASYVL